MEVPEKIQVHLIKNNCDDWSIEGYSFLGDKQIGMTEYTRTDAFIYKFKKFMSEICRIYDITDINGYTVDSKDLIQEFENYIKGG